ncbi:RNA polymerase sigma factor [Erythrobacter sp. THAF29]|uniref:RNA polymerase sigma factor n=1 Tax=Erythrobacter sp. THAF29 TaxID=2587851 RepID=UPI001267E775|nr:RNA polymerase sigma factor [Erythrobacter sp. THAF29]QFT76860.1 ECF RNA polymerase sigma factor SigH [Erythrobacter sp. THAF29]
MTRAGETGRGDLRRQIIQILPRLRRFCLALARRPDVADDLCQATVERALARADQFVPGSKLDSWMYKIAQNIWIDEGRRQQTRGTEVDVDHAYDMVGSDGLKVVEGRSDLARAREALASLPEEQRVLITLVVLDGMSYKDAAETLAIPMGTVMSRIARARRAIDKHVNGEPAQ